MLHWVLDMSFPEDYSRIQKGNAPYAMAIIRHVALGACPTLGIVARLCWFEAAFSII